MALDESQRARDHRADYDFASEEVARPGLVEDLESLVEGEVRFDSYTRQLYATDASAYEVQPVGVIFPRSTADVSATVEYCADRGIPVLPRGGGTSLGGQAVNEAVVLDFTRYMDAIVEVDADDRLARVQAGAILGTIDAELESTGLMFAPDPAWGDKSTIGGAIGNNSTGAHSLQYGKTAAHLETVEVVLADGTVTTFGEIELTKLRDIAAGQRRDIQTRIYSEILHIVDEEADAIRAAYPEVSRNVSGYGLDRLIEEAKSGSINLARLLAGSEGTLAIVTEATVSLEPLPASEAMALLAYDDLGTAMADIVAVLEHDPAAVEVLDDVLLDQARNSSEFGRLVESTVPEGTGAVVLVEFYAESDIEGRQRVADLLVDRGPPAIRTAVAHRAERDGTDTPSRAVHADEAYEAAERERFWELRKAGLPLLLSRTTDEKHVSFIEDTAVPPARLPEYVADFQAVLAEHDTQASFYGHAGPGCLHVRPLVNTTTPDGIDAMKSISQAVTDLVVEYGGSVSGEHGDGRARTQWNRKMYGDRVWRLFRDLKSAFDPDWILNPGQICGDVQMTDNLRFDTAGAFDTSFDPALNWENPNGLQGMVELCHGCGGCRGPQHTTGGVMCPTYRAAEEEIATTRGRANLLRQAMEGDLPADPTDDAFASEVLDLCIGCKGCARDCPSEVDMAKLKVEIAHARHRRHGATWRERLFASVDRAAGFGSLVAPVSNWLQHFPGVRHVLEWTMGIAKERSLPTFRHDSFAARLGDRTPIVQEEAAQRRAIILTDPYTNYIDPEVGMAAVRVLEAAGIHVRLANDVADGNVQLTDSGRAAYSQGFIERARTQADRTVSALEPLVAAGWDVVVIEPSEAVMVQSDYTDLLSGEKPVSVITNTYGLCEYLDRFQLDASMSFAAPDEHLTYHGHCHQKAIRKDHHAVGVLRRAGYDVTPLDSGCCGMAGSFGYEAEHYAMSQAIGQILFDQIADSPGDTVVAPGASCRTQLGDRKGTNRPPHPVQKLDEAIH